MTWRIKVDTEDGKVVLYFINNKTQQVDFRAPIDWPKAQELSRALDEKAAHCSVVHYH